MTGGVFGFRRNPHACKHPHAKRIRVGREEDGKNVPVLERCTKCGRVREVLPLGMWSGWTKRW